MADRSPGYKITERDLTEYVPDRQNANKGTVRGQSMIERSIEEVGPGRSLVADRNDLLPAGNKTQQALIDLGITKVVEIETDGDTVLVHKRRDWDLTIPDGEARKYAYYDNRAGELSLDWSETQILEDINRGILPEAIFNDDELTAILNKMGSEPHYKPPRHDNAESSELQQKCQTAPGQIWRIESRTQPEHPHRLMCGDSRTDLPKLMGQRRAALLVTSPPYCVNKDYEQNMTVEDWKLLIRDVFIAAKPFAPTWFVNLANRRNGNDGFEMHTFGDMVDIFAALEVRLIALRIWTKPATWEHANPYWHQTYKPVDDFEFLGLFGEKPKHKTRLTKEENTEWGYRGCWDFGSVQSNQKQSARYPTTLPLRAMRLLTDFGDLVLDPFVGSGTTIEAGEEIGRTVYAMEKEPADVAVALELLAEDLKLVVEKESEGEQKDGKDEQEADG